MTKTLVRQDIIEAAREVGCDEAAIKALVEIEAAASGFDHRGRPKILFEPHIFERELNALGYLDRGEVIQSARDRGLASPRWNRRLYPRSQDGRWRQLEEAMEINETAALKSASYGLGQVCGFNHRLCGYNTVQDFVADMRVSEGRQLMAMIRFIISSKLDDELRRRDWVRFARGYNGPSYHVHRYDDKLARAYGRHSTDPEVFWRNRPSGGHAAGESHAHDPEEDPAPSATDRKTASAAWFDRVFEPS